MARRSPAQNYIKWLIVHPDGLSTARIIDRLEDEDLDPIEDRYIDRLRTELSPPDPFYPLNRKHKPSQDFLYQELLIGLARPDTDMNMALRVLKSPRAKECVETMILAHAPVHEIAYLLTKKFDSPATPRAVDRYKHFFWNIDLLDSVGMRALLNLRGENAQQRVPGGEAAIRRAYYTDPRRTAAELPYSPLSARLALVSMGFVPQGGSNQETAEQIKQLGLLRALEAIQRNDPHASERAMGYMSVVKMAVELLTEEVRPEQAILESVRRLSLRTQENAVPLVHMLTGGNHTADIGVGTKEEDAPT